MIAGNRLSGGRGDKALARFQYYDSEHQAERRSQVTALIPDQRNRESKLLPVNQAPVF